MSEDWSSILEQDLQKLSEVVGVQPATTEKFIAGERRNVAMLFLDLKGFTAMSEIMDHEMVHKIVGGIMQALSNVVKGHGGYVDKFEGDLIMALFGAKKTSDNDCIRAVSCGLKMFDVLADVNKIFSAKGYNIGARCGISYGSVTVAPDPKGNLTAMGDEVNLASRMESTAKVNTVQVTSVVQRECGDYFEWENLGEITVKGKKLPVHVFRPIGPGLVQTERWDRAARVSRSPMVGREKEMKKLRTIWDKLQEGRADLNPEGGAKHFVIGVKAEAGIGKSRLIYEFINSVKENTSQAESAAAGEVKVLKGQTLSYAQPLNWLWISLLQDFFKISKDDSNAKVKFDRVIKNNEELHNGSPFLAELLSIPSDDPRLKYLDHESKHRETLSALRDVVRHCINKDRTVVILEDLHWLDNASKEALEFVIANCDSRNPILFIFMYRPEREDLLPVVSKDHVIYDEIILSAIADDACRSLIESMLGQSSIEVEDFLLKHSLGNPFFLEEFVLDMIESGDMEEVDGNWQLSTGKESIKIPTSMSGLINSRIDRLTSEHKSGLQHSSVIGMEILMKLYGRLVEKLKVANGPEAILSGLEKRDFIAGIKDVAELKYVFKHILTCSTAYETILKHNRMILHRHVAEALEELFPGDKAIYKDIAYHFEHAEDWEKAREYYTMAGKHFEESLRYDDASVFLQKALTISESAFEPNHLDIAESLNNMAELCRKQGLYDKAEPLYRKSLKIREEVHGSQHPDVAESLNNLAELSQSRGAFDSAEPLYERALEIRRNVLGTEHPGFAESLNNLASFYYSKGEYDHAEPMWEMVLEIRKDVLGSQHPDFATSLNNLALLYRRQGLYDKAKPMLERALKIREKVLGDQHPLVAHSLNNLALLFHSQGVFDRAEPLYEKALEIREQILGVKHPSIAMSLSNLAALYSSKKLFSKAEPLHERALKIREDVHGSEHPEVAQSLNNLSHIHLSLGDYTKAEPLGRRALEIYESNFGSNHPDVALSLNNLGSLYSKSGAYDKAEPLYKRSIAIWEKASPNHPYLAGLLDSYADLLRETGRDDEALAQQHRAKMIRDKIA